MFTCEHGGNRVPAAFRDVFLGHDDVLQTHRGWDIGALDLARKLRRTLSAPLQYSTTTRLLIDLNRSPHNPARFSEFTRVLPADRRAAIETRYHTPYWRQARDDVATMLAECGRALMFSVHSFTPRLFGVTRNAEIGLLYDPRRERERRFALALRRELRRVAPQFSVRLNYPYKGRNDALPTRLRQELPERRFLGVELELNQKLVGRDAETVAATALRDALKALAVERHGYTHLIV